MFKINDKVEYTRPTYSQNQRDINDPGDGAWITVKGKDKTEKGVIANLSRFFLPVTLNKDKSVVTIPYELLTFGYGNKVSFQGKLPDRHKIINGKPCNIIGKPIIVKGKLLNVGELKIPILVGNDLQHIPWKELKFEKEKK